MTELRAERIVIHALKEDSLVASSCLDHLADIAEMVAVVVVEGEVVLAGIATICRCLAVALLELELVDAPVPQSEAPPEEVVRGVRAQDLRRGKLPGAADGDIEDVGMASVSTVFSQLSFYYGYFSLQI